MASDKYYTIIRVKRKYSDEESNQDRYDPATKRLRHIGSFTKIFDEESLNSNNILGKMGFKDRKRIQFNDLDSEQFSVYCKQQKLDENSKAGPITNTETNDMKESSMETKSDVDNKCPKSEEDNNQITCNGDVMKEIKDQQKDKFLYDYYVLLDDLTDFSDHKDEEYQDDDEPSSNDENYPYNDYPDEGEITDDEDESEDEENESDFEKFIYYDEEDSDDAYREYRDTKNFCGNFDKMNLDSDDEEEEEEDSADEYDKEFFKNLS